MCLDLGQGVSTYTALKNSGTTLFIGGGTGAATAADGNFTNVVFGNSANVGIGIAAPPTLFSVNPVQYATSKASQSGSTITGSGTSWTSAMVGSIFTFTEGGGTAGTITAVNSSTSLTVTTSQTVALQYYTINYPSLNASSSGNVGIGTPSPTTQLHINGTSGATLRIVDGNEGTGKVLTSDANGVASWATPSSSGGAQTSAVSSPLTFDVSSGATMDWDIGAQTNIVINIWNMQNGSSYTVVPRGTGVGSTTINCYSDGGTTALTSSFMPSNTNRAANASIYSVIRVGNYCYISWSTGWN